MLTLRSSLLSCFSDIIAHGTLLNPIRKGVLKDSYHLPWLHSTIDEDVAPIEHVLLKQVHGNDIVDVAPHWQNPLPAEGDALVTAVSGIMLCIKTADCVPLLLFNPVEKIVAAAHLGWRGAYKNLALRSLEKVATEKQFSNIVAFLGPSIAAASYEVDQTFREKFLSEHPSANNFFCKFSFSHQWHFDLSGFIAHQLKMHGVEFVDQCTLDTYANNDLCFSHRRNTHKAKNNDQRHLTYIYLK